MRNELRQNIVKFVTEWFDKYDTLWISIHDLHEIYNEAQTSILDKKTLSTFTYLLEDSMKNYVDLSDFQGTTKEYEASVQIVRSNKKEDFFRLVELDYDETLSSDDYYDFSNDDEEISN